MDMFLKSGENLSIENPSEEKLLEVFSNMSKETYCLSNDRRVGSIYSEFAENLLEIKRSSVNTFQISIQYKINNNEPTLETIRTVVDLATAIKIAKSYSSDNNLWKELATWKVCEESALGIFNAFNEIVVKKSKGTIIFGLISIVLVVLVIVFLRSNFSPSQFFKSEKVSDVKDVQEYIIGDVAKSKYFAFKVHGVQLSDRVGNFLIGQDAGQGNKFLIIDIEIQNLDKESRLIDGGEVRVSYNGKWLKYESPEPVFGDDFITFDVLNPLTKVRGKVVFKVPAQIQGPFYWIPPRTQGKIKLSNERATPSSSSSISNSSYSKYVGKYSSEFLSDIKNQDMLRSKVTNNKDELNKIKSYFDVATPIKNEGKFIVGEGCKARECPDFNGIFVLNTENNFFALFYYEAKQRPNAQVTYFCGGCKLLEFNGKTNILNYELPNSAKLWLKERDIL